MNDFDEVRMVRAMLGELSTGEHHRHIEQLGADAGYAARFAQLTALRTELLAHDAPSLPPGLDQRVLGELRARQSADGFTEVMPRQFWRMAVPAMAAALVLIALAVGSPTNAGTEATLSLASWYPISIDPTVAP